MTTGLLPATAADPQTAAAELATHLHASSQALMDVLTAIKSRFTVAKLAQPPPVVTLEQTIMDLGTRFRDAVAAGQVPIQAWRQVASKTSDALLQMSREMQQLKLDDGSLARAAAAAKSAIMAAGGRGFGDAAPDAAAAGSGAPSWLFPVGVLGIAGLAYYTYRSMQKDKKKRYGARDIQLDDDDDADGYDAVDGDDDDSDDDFGEEMQLEPPSHEPESELGGRGRRKKKSRVGITRVKPLKRKRSLDADDSDDEEDSDD